jgi:hypothetical protein
LIFLKNVGTFYFNTHKCAGGKIKNIHLDGRWWVESTHTEFHHGFQLLRARLESYPKFLFYQLNKNLYYSLCLVSTRTETTGGAEGAQAPLPTRISVDIRGGNEGGGEK